MAPALVGGRAVDDGVGADVQALLRRLAPERRADDDRAGRAPLDEHGLGLDPRARARAPHAEPGPGGIGEDERPRAGPDPVLVHRRDGEAHPAPLAQAGARAKVAQVGAGRLEAGPELVARGRLAAEGDAVGGAAPELDAQRGSSRLPPEPRWPGHPGAPTRDPGPGPPPRRNRSARRPSRGARPRRSRGPPRRSRARRASSPRARGGRRSARAAHPSRGRRAAARAASRRARSRRSPRPFAPPARSSRPAPASRCPRTRPVRVRRSGRGRRAWPAPRAAPRARAGSSIRRAPRRWRRRRAAWVSRSRSLRSGLPGLRPTARPPARGRAAAQ